MFHLCADDLLYRIFTSRHRWLVGLATLPLCAVSSASPAPGTPERTPRPSAVFNHLMTTDGTLVAQADGWPQEGPMLTTQWQAGEYAQHGYALALPSDAPPGPYLDALDVLRGHFSVYFAANKGREPLFIYLIALAVGPPGKSPFAQRLAAFPVGLLTVAATGPAGQEFTGERIAAETAELFAVLVKG